MLPLATECECDDELCPGMMTHVHSVESHMVKMQTAVGAMGDPASPKELDTIQDLFNEFNNRTKYLSSDSLQHWINAGVDMDLGASPGSGTEHLTAGMQHRWQQLSGQLEVTGHCIV